MCNAEVGDEQKGEDPTVNDLQEMVNDLLSESRVRSRGFFQPEMVNQLISTHRSGRADWSLQIWQLLTLELWMQAFMDSPQKVPAFDLPQSSATLGKTYS